MICLLIVVYFLILFAIGVGASRRITTSEDYFLAGRKLPFYLAVPSIVATWFGAGSCLGVAAAMYSGGIEEIIADPFGCSISLVLCGLFFAVPLRKRGLTTINEILGNSYGRALEKVASLSTIPFYVGTLAAQFLAVGIVLSYLLHLPLEGCVLVAGMVVVCYTLLGGLWAVVLTDGVQLFILTASLCILAWPLFSDYSALKNCLGILFSETDSLLPRVHPQHGYLDYWGQWLMTGLGAMMGQDLIQRILACKSTKTAQQSAICGGFIYLAIGAIPILLGIYGRTLFESIDQPQHLVPLMAQQFSSPFIYALFLMGILSITMSTADSYLLAGATVITQNIMKPSVANPLKRVRWISLLIALASMIVALWIQDIYAIMVHSSAFLSVAVFVPVTMALCLKTTHSRAGWVSVVVGVISWACYIIYQFPTGDWDALLYAAALVGTSCSFVGYVIAHLILSYSTRLQTVETI